MTGTTGAPEPESSRSALTAVGFGCMAGGGIGVGGAVLFAVLLLAGSNARGAALLSLAAALAGGALVFRRLREDPPVAVGLLIGLALIGLLAGMCAGQLG